MRIISRYILWEFLRVLALLVLAFILIYILVDFMEKIDDFIEADVHIYRVGLYYLLSIPKIILNVVPVAILISILISFGLLAANSEIVALKSAGVSFFSICLPILLSAIVLGLGLFFFSDVVIPYSAMRTNSIWIEEVEKRQDVSSGRYEDVWFKSKKMIYHFKVYDMPLKTLEGVSVFRLDDNFGIEERIEAKDARLKGDGWVFYNGLIKKYSDDGRVTLSEFDEAVFFLPEMPKEFTQPPLSSDAMSLRELHGYAKRIRTEGHDPVKYMVDLNLKISFSFICLVMALLGLSLSFRKEKGSGMYEGVATGVGLAFVFYVFLGLSRSLGYTGVIPPILAAWVPNILFLGLGSIMISLIRH